MRRVWILVVVAVLVVVVVPSAEAQPANPGGWGWGAGVGFSDNLIGDDVVSGDNVVIDQSGVVRVQRTDNVRARMLLETHHTFAAGRNVAIGPFLAVEPGGNLLAAAGAGVMFELKRAPGQPSMNVGVGVLVDFAVERLAAGWVDGQPAPGPTVQTTIREEAALLVMVTVGL